MLITLRWPSQVRSLDGLELDESVTEAKLDKRELEMAKRLVEDMASHWEPDEYKDSFSDKIMKLVEEKAAKGQLHAVEEEEEVAGKGADIIDLTDLPQAQPAFLRRRRQGQGQRKGRGRREGSRQVRCLAFAAQGLRRAAG